MIITGNHIEHDLNFKQIEKIVEKESNVNWTTLQVPDVC